MVRWLPLWIGNKKWQQVLLFMIVAVFTLSFFHFSKERPSEAGGTYVLVKETELDSLPISSINHQKNVASRLDGEIQGSRGNQICQVPQKLPGELEARRRRADEACDRLRNEIPSRWRRQDRGLSTGILSKLRWNPERHLIYCHLPKVASTTWAWHLLRSAGLKDKEISDHRNVHILLNERLPPPSVEDYDNGFLKDSLAFMVSRHPYQRLISAYKNKIVEAEKRRQHYVDLRKEILTKYQNPDQILTNVEIPSFRAFCEYIANTTEAWLADLSKVPPPDLHWMPMTYVCSPCNVQYDVFSKLETMEQDTAFIATQCDLRDIIENSVMMNPSPQEKEEERNNVNKLLPNSATSVPDESSDYSKYMAELSTTLLNRLQKIYKFDFEIFGYDAEGIS